MDQLTIAAIIITVTLILYVTEKIPLAVTSVLALLAFGATGILSYSKAFASFGSSVVMLVAGMSIFGIALLESGFPLIVAKGISHLIHLSEKGFLLLVMIIVCICTLFLGGLAVTAICLPLVSVASEASKRKFKKKNLFMIVGIMSVLGGNLTLVGSSSMVLAQGILLSTPNCRGMGFFEPALVGFPIFITIFLAYAFFLYRLQLKVFNFKELENKSEKQPGEMLVDKRKLYTSIGILFLCIFGFIVQAADFGAIAMFGACLLVLTKCVNLKSALKNSDWNTIIILGCAIGLAAAFDASGLGKWLALAGVNLFGGEEASTFLVFTSFTLLSMFVTCIMSDAAAIAMFVPIAISLATTLHCDPMLFVMGAIMGSKSGFATPICTAPVTMTLQAGYRFMDYVIIGGIISVLCTVVTILVLPLVYGL